MGVDTVSKIAAAIGLHPSSILFPDDVDKEIVDGHCRRNSSRHEIFVAD